MVLAVVGGALALCGTEAGLRGASVRRVDLQASAAKRKGAGASKGFAPAPRRAAAEPPSCAPLDGFDDLYNWLASNGATRRVAVADFGGLRGAAAVDHIPEGEAVIAIPSHLAVDLGVEGADPLPGALELLRYWRGLVSPDESQGDLVTRARDLAPFLRSIPPPDSKDLTTTDFFSPEELQALQWQPLVAEAEARQQALEGAVAAQGSVDEAELRWARWVILSRVLTVVDTDARLARDARRKLLIPLVDMCNHNLNKVRPGGLGVRLVPRTPGRAGLGHVLSTASLVPLCLQGLTIPPPFPPLGQWNGIPSGRVGGDLKIIAARDIAAGEQVTIQYGGGSLSNDRMLAEYGFVDPAAADLDRAMLSAVARGPDGPALLGREAPLRATSLAEDRDLLQTLAPGSRLWTAVQFRMAMKRALAGQRPL